MRRCDFITGVLSLVVLSSSSTAQQAVPAGVFSTRVFRPSLFVSRDMPRYYYHPQYTTLDAVRYSTYDYEFSGVRYYDSLVKSPYGLSASRQLYDPVRYRSLYAGPTVRIDSWLGTTWDPAVPDERVHSIVPPTYHRP